MPGPHEELRELARQAWYGLPPQKRTAENVRKVLRRGGIENPPSKGSINRWAIGWKKAVERTVEVLLPAQPQRQPQAMPMARPAPEPIDTLDDVPDVLQDILSPRLLHMAKGQGLDRVEHAVMLLSDAIASKAPQIAEMLLETETETESTVKGEDGAETTKRTEKAKVARSAVTALTQLAQAMHTVASARSMVSVAHANFSQGDLYGAQARVMLDTGRADRAKDITGKVVSPGGLTAKDEVMATLREGAGGK